MWNLKNGYLNLFQLISEVFQASVWWFMHIFGPNLLCLFRQRQIFPMSCVSYIDIKIIILCFNEFNLITKIFIKNIFLEFTICLSFFSRNPGADSGGLACVVVVSRVQTISDFASFGANCFEEYCLLIIFQDDFGN